jgi:GT2 family glycosyltransferase
LEKCLTGLAAQALPPLEVVIVDNGPGDERTHAIAEQFRAKYVQEPHVGLSRARNRGAVESNGEVIAYLDDDAYPESDWLGNLLQVFEDADVMTVGGRTVAPNGDQEAHDLCVLIQGPGSNMKAFVVDRKHPQWFEITAFGGVGTGMNMAFRREAFQHMPGFDTRLGLPGAAGEEQFAVFNLVDKGFKAAYAPTAVVTHPTSYTVEGLRQRYLAACSYAISYILFLFVNLPQHRYHVMKFLSEAVRGVKREWRTGDPTGAISAVHVPRTRVMLARMNGVWKYLSSRRSPHEAVSLNSNGRIHFAKSPS